MSQSIIDKLVKLYALAAAGGTPEESKAAWETAERMRHKYGIDHGDIEEAKGVLKAGQSSFNIGEDFIKTGRVMRYDLERNVARIMQRCFGVKVIFCTESSTGRKRHAYYLIGDELDRAIAKAVYPLLVSSLLAGIRRTIKELTEATGFQQKWTASLGKSYVDGVEVGYVTMSEEGKAKAIATAKKADADAYALVLVDKDKAVVAYVEEKFPDLQRLPDRPEHVLNKHAFVRGTVDGANLSLSNDNKLEGRK